MQTLNGVVESEGPLLDVLVNFSGTTLQQLRQAGNPLPPPVSARALLDSGAEVSCADPAVLKPFLNAGLIPEQFVFANMPAAGGLNLAPEYKVSLTIVHPASNPRSNLVLRNYPVITQPLGPLGYQMLLGRDVLAKCLFVYDGPGSRFTLAYG